MARFPLLGTLVVLVSLITRHPALAVSKDQLDIQLNDDMARTKKVAFGSQVQIAGLSDWKDEEIVHLAMMAHQKMIDVQQSTEMKKKMKADYGMNARLVGSIPGVTTTLIVDNTAYISTSIKGGQFFYLAHAQPNRYQDLNPENPCAGPVQTALINCKTTEGWGHRTGASCGEPWAAQAFCSTQSTRSLKDAKIVTINTSKKDDSTNGQPQIAHPCGDISDTKKYAGEWGCTQFTENLGIYVIPETTASTVKDVADSDVVNSALRYRREPTETQANEDTSGSEQTSIFV